MSVRPDYSGLVFYAVRNEKIEAIVLTKRDSEDETECNVIGFNKLQYSIALPEEQSVD
jgi:hypothetical protein